VYKFLLIAFFFFTPFYAYANHHDGKIVIEKATSGSEVFKIGKEIYKNNCASCHQINLSGQVNWKENLDDDGHRLAPPMDGSGHTWHHDDKTLFYIIKYGLAKLVPNYQGKMMGFGDSLSDEEIKATLAYVKSFWSKDKYGYQMKLNK
jgi:mono/diheme cytochrome c family protein